MLKISFITNSESNNSSKVCNFPEARVLKSIGAFTKQFGASSLPGLNFLVSIKKFNMSLIIRDNIYSYFIQLKIVGEGVYLEIGHKADLE